MSPVIISGRIIIPDTIQTILQGMIIYFFPAQIISDRIGITKHINILILPEVHRDIRLLELSQQLAELHSGKHI